MLRTLIAGRDFVPLGAFLGTYVFTCYLGVVLLVWGPHEVRYLYTFFTGVAVPDLTGAQTSTLLALLHWPVLALSLGYIGASALLCRFSEARREPLTELSMTTALWGAYGAVLLLGYFSVYRGGAFRGLSAWFNYDNWVEWRWTLFSTLSYPEFVNIYMVIPVLSAIVARIVWSRHRSSVLVIGVLLPGFLLSLLLFQKKQPLVYCVVTFLPFAISSHRISAILVRLALIFGVGATLYSLMMVLPTTNWAGAVSAVTVKRGDIRSQDMFVSTESASTSAESASTSAESAKPATGGVQVAEKPSGAGDIARADDQRSHSPSAQEQVERIAALYGPEEADAFKRTIDKHMTVAYAFSGVTTFIVQSVLFRTAAPAIFYPITFPDRHAYYGIDLPFDNFSPDDNRAVWDVMWPKTPGGSVMVPLQFGFFAQGGLLGALLLAIVSGVVLAVLWWYSNRRLGCAPLAYVQSSLCVLLAVFFASDSARGSLAASYGVGWGVVAVMMVWLAVRRQVRA